MTRRLTPRRRSATPTANLAVDELRRRRRAAQKVLLQNVPLDSPAGRRHEARLAKAAGAADRVAAYEQTLREVGLLDRYEEIVHTTTATGGTA